MARNQSPNLRAGGNISPATFVKVDTSADNQALQAGANDPVIGISQVGTHQPPGVAGSDAFAAVAGENVELFGLGDVCNLTAGSGGWTRGQFLKSDASGNGVPVAASGVQQNIGAVALESCNAGEQGRVQVLILNSVVPAGSGSVLATDITGTDSSLDIAGQAASSGNTAGGNVPIAGGVGFGTGAGGLVSLTGGAGGATNGTGGATPIVAGSGTGTGSGGVASLTGGTSGAGATGNGGVSKVVGGAALSTNGSGGAAQVTGGVATGTGTGGAVTITSGASAGASGTAGNVTIDVGAANGGTAGVVQISGIVAGNVTVGNATNPALKVVPGTAGTGLSVTSAAAGSGLAIAVISSGTNENLTENAKGSGTITIGGISTGLVSIGRGSVSTAVFSSTKTSLATQNTTPTAAQLLGGYIAHASTTGAGTATLDTAANLDTAVPGVATGDSFQCVYANTGTQTVTITTNTGLSLKGTAAVGSGKNAILDFFRTGSAAWDVVITVSA